MRRLNDRSVERLGGNFGGNSPNPSRYIPHSSAISRYLCDSLHRTISMSGGIAEAIHRGERRRRVVFQFARLNCGAHHDLADAEKVLADLRALPGRRYGLERYTQRALKLMLAHWPAVEAIAAVLIRDLRIEGSTIEELVP